MTRSLHLAAAPIFTLMGLATSVLDNGEPNALCSVATGVWMSGMAPMYLLMAAFHLGPWLKLMSDSFRNPRSFWQHPNNGAEL
jgi:hypothetical protein